MPIVQEKRTLFPNSLILEMVGQNEIKYIQVKIFASVMQYHMHVAERTKIDLVTISYHSTHLGKF